MANRSVRNEKQGNNQKVVALRSHFENSEETGLTTASLVASHASR